MIREIIFLTLLCTLPLSAIAQKSNIENTVKILTQIIEEKGNNGYIDSQEYLLLMPERKAAETEVATFAKSLEEQLALMTAEYQESVQDFQDKEGTYSKKRKEKIIAEITGLEQRIRAFQESAQEALKEKEQELLEPILSLARSAIEYVGLERDYNYIFDIVDDSKIVLYEKENTGKTKKIVGELD